VSCACAQHRRGYMGVRKPDAAARKMECHFAPAKITDSLNAS